MAGGEVGGEWFLPQKAQDSPRPSLEYKRGSRAQRSTKKMDAGYTLDDVCMKLLDDVGVLPDMSHFPQVVTLNFRVNRPVNGTHVMVRFRCERVARLDWKTSAWDPPGYDWALQTRVMQCKREDAVERIDRFSDPAWSDPQVFWPEELSENLWQVNIFGGSMALEIICEIFSWEIEEISEESHKAMFTEDPE
jgi:hypothetical protein